MNYSDGNGIESTFQLYRVVNKNENGRSVTLNHLLITTQLLLFFFLIFTIKCDYSKVIEWWSI